MIIAGIILTVIGLALLFYCISTVYRAKKAGLEGDEMVAKLRGLVAVNLAAVGLSGIGLALVVVGILIG